MSEQVTSAIASELALLTQVIDFPVEPLGYGSDISGADDVAADMSEVDAFTTLAVAQAVVRRLDCPRGALPDDADYGIDLRSYLNRGVTADEIRSLGGQIRSEVSKDDRVDSLVVTVRPNSVGSELRLELAITPIDPNVGGFTLTLVADNAQILIDEIRSTI
jgi:hypothetical protein